MRALLMTLVLASTAAAQTEIPAPSAQPSAQPSVLSIPKAPPPTMECSLTPERPDHPSGEARGASHVTLLYTPVAPGLFVPFKHGPSLSLVLSPDWTGELEYLDGQLGSKFGSINFGGFRETNTTAKVRYYPGTNSFHFIGGLGRREYRLTLGSEWLNEHIPNGLGDNGDLLRVKQTVVEAGIGNRWQWEHGFTFGHGFESWLLPDT